MESHPRHRLPKWPFFLADVVLLTFAAVTMLRVGGPNTPTDRLIWIGTVCIGCLISLVPFLYAGNSASENSTTEDDTRFEEIKAALQSSSDKLPELLVPHLEKMQAAMQERFSGIEGGVQASRKSFDGLVAVLNQQQSAEVSHARLEAEKLRKGEGEWLQLVVHLMDQAFALFQAAANSGQHAVAQQLGLYYAHCRDLVRRKGLVPLLPEPGTLFQDETQMVSEWTQASEGAKIAAVLAPGYSFQKQIIRKALVSLVVDTVPPHEEATTQARIEEPMVQAEPNEPAHVAAPEVAVAEPQGLPAEQILPVEIAPTQESVPPNPDLPLAAEAEATVPLEELPANPEPEKPERKRSSKSSRDKAPDGSEPQGLLL